MENIIFNELKIRGFNVDVGVVTQYGKNEEGSNTRKQLEIDFVCNKGPNAITSSLHTQSQTRRRWNKSNAL